MEIEDIVKHLKDSWSSPRLTSGSDLSRFDFTLTCRFSDVGSTAKTIDQYIHVVPEGIKEFWRISEWAELFKDETYGQWGLRIMTPEESLQESARQIKERATEFEEDDLVIGQFFGDSELFLIRCNEAEPDFGKVLISLPIDPRSCWPVVASSFSEFLNMYAKSEGEKFWEEV